MLVRRVDRPQQLVGSDVVSSAHQDTGGARQRHEVRRGQLSGEADVAQVVYRAVQVALLAEPGARLDGFTCGKEPAPPGAREQRNGCLGALLRPLVLAAPAMRLGLAQEQAPEGFALRAASNATVAPREARLEVVP